MSSDPPELGKGLFGYRKSAVNQIIADRDIMLRQAEGRVRAAESRVADLENELGSMRERNTRMDEQLERLRQQLDALASGGEAPPPQAAVPQADVPKAAAPPAVAEDDAWQDGSASDASGAMEPPVMESPVMDSLAMEPHAPEMPAADASNAYDEEARHTEASVEAQDAWPADDDWTSGEQMAPQAASDDTAVPDEDEVPYGAEVKLAEHEPAESPAAAWMQPADVDDEAGAEPDEVALAAGYGFEDYEADEQQAYGDFGSAEEDSQETPSPFAQFPFTAGGFDEAEEPSSSSQDEYEAEAAPRFHGFEQEVAEAAFPSTASGQMDDFGPAPAAPAAPAAPPAQTPQVSPETADITNRFLTEELAGILAAAEESAARIVERARATTQRQIARSNRVWREVQAEVSRFASWRQDVEPIIRAVQSKVDSVRSEIEEVPEKIRQALAPMADSISGIDADLAELAAASNPPLLLTPSGLEAEGSDDAWGLDEDADYGLDDLGSGDLGDAIRNAPEETFGESFGGGAGAEGPGHLHAG